VGFPSPPGTFDRTYRFGVVFFDVFPVQFRVCRVGFAAELSDIVGGDVASPLPSLPVFDKRLGHTLPGQPRRIRFSEVSRRDGLVDTGPLRGVFECIIELAVTDFFGLRQFRPQGRVGVVTIRVVGKPPIQERDRWDKRHRPLALLPVDEDLQPVVVVGDVADAKVFKFPTSGTRIERDGYQGGVTGVPGIVYHGFHVVVPCKHISRVRAGVVTVACPRRHPSDTVGLIFDVAVGDTSPEDPKGGPIVGVLPFVFVRSVYPPNDFFGGVAVFKGVGKPTDVFGDSGTMTQKVAVPKVGIFGLQQVQLVAEFYQHVGVLFGDFVRFADSVAQVDDLRSGFDHTIQPIPLMKCINGLLNLGVKSRPRLKAVSGLLSPFYAVLRREQMKLKNSPFYYTDTPTQYGDLVYCQDTITTVATLSHDYEGERGR